MSKNLKFHVLKRSYCFCFISNHIIIFFKLCRPWQDFQKIKPITRGCEWYSHSFMLHLAVNKILCSYIERLSLWKVEESCDILWHYINCHLACKTFDRTHVPAIFSDSLIPYDTQPSIWMRSCFKPTVMGFTNLAL